MRFFTINILWLALGMALIGTSNNYKPNVMLVSSVGESSSIKDESTADFDGPHIFYRNDTTYIKQVFKEDSIAYARVDTILNSIKRRPITCFIDETTFFRTKIKRNLTIENSKYNEPKKIIAISDIEGNFSIFRNFLLNNGVINNENKWIFKNGHLVLVGDFFDRGLNVTECLWFIYHLEQEALKNGGYVHFILGNHEIMNMNSDFRYVRHKYFHNTYLIEEGYKDWYSEKTELGRWLRTKNVMEKIGNYLFLHGGISEEINALEPSINKVNRTARRYYYKSDMAVKSNTDLPRTIYDSKTSPFWYRGYIRESTSQEAVNQTLKKYSVRKIVVGHTLVEDVSYFYDKKVIGIDTKHVKGDSEGLLIENGKEFRIDKYGTRYRIE